MPDTVTKRQRFFIRNPESLEPWAYCGDLSDRGDLVRAFGNFLLSECEADLTGVSEFTVEIMVKNMTDAEVAAIPEM